MLTHQRLSTHQRPSRAASGRPVPQPSLNPASTPTTKTRILEAARAIADRHSSIQGVTISLDAVAQEANLTKPGLMYHFPTKEALMMGLVHYVASHWDELLRAETGGDPHTRSPFERHRAYVTVATSVAISRANYWVFTDALYHRALADVWREHLDPWFAAETLAPAAASLLAAARFCADGAWMSESTGLFRTEDLAAVRTHALELVDRAEQLPKAQPSATAATHEGTP